MCVMGLGAALGIGGAAAGAAGTLQTLATIATIGGTLYSGFATASADRQQAAAYDAQAKTEAQLTATQDQRQRLKMGGAIAQQRAEIAGRGIDMSSPTAVYLGQTAARELSFDSQAIRSEGVARQTELSTQARLSRANATTAMWKGTLGAAGHFLTEAPELWPGLLRERQLA
jgi:hypothetical protein